MSEEKLTNEQLDKTAADAKRAALRKETRTTLVNLRTYGGPEDYVLVDRRTIFGNPFPISNRCTREQSIAKFKTYFEARTKRDRVFRAAVKSLRGKRLACWCTPLACHGDVIIEYLENLKNG